MSSADKNCETEVKVEISEWRRNRLINRLLALGFTDEGIFYLSDYYVEAKESAHGGPGTFDIERYRSDGRGKFDFTKKFWQEVEGGEPVRVEEEHPINKELFDAVVATHPKALLIQKTRHLFTQTSAGGLKVSVSIDVVKFAHPPNVLRHFVEVEVLEEDPTKVKETMVFLRSLLADLLGLEALESYDAPSMFAIAFKKL